MNTLEIVNAYVAVRRAQGVRLNSSARVLRQFASETGNQPLSEVTSEAVAAFLRGRGELSATWKTKRGLLAGFYRFAIARGHTTILPLSKRPPQLPPPTDALCLRHRRNTVPIRCHRHTELLTQSPSGSDLQNAPVDPLRCRIARRRGYSAKSL